MGSIKVSVSKETIKKVVKVEEEFVTLRLPMKVAQQLRALSGHSATHDNNEFGHNMLELYLALGRADVGLPRIARWGDPVDYTKWEFN